ncbi:hypothetical protein D3C85_1672020 [compost metagenome]
MMPRQCRVGRYGYFQYRELRLTFRIGFIGRPIPRDALLQCNFRLDFRFVRGVCNAGESGRKDKQVGANLEYLHDFLIIVIVLRDQF